MSIQGFAVAAFAVAVGLLIASKLGWIKVNS